MQYDTVLDVKGLNCPLPLLKLKQLLAKTNHGDIIQVLATDPAAHLDIGVFIDKSSHKMLLHDRIDELQYFYIKAVHK